LLDQPAFEPSMATLQIGGGKKQKLRPGDILGALTGNNSGDNSGGHSGGYSEDHGIAGDQVGKINIYENWSYVAISLSVVKAALKKLEKGKLKGRSFRVRRIRG
jgi:ATP-independent RNA helicase DbpA